MARDIQAVAEGEPYMQLTYYALSVLVVLSTVIPFLSYQHWTVRWFDFAKVQFTALGVLAFALGWATVPGSAPFWLAQTLLFLSLLHNLKILVQYSRWYKVQSVDVWDSHSDSITLLSANVLQFNTDYERFLRLIEDTEPDIVVTMESNEAWDTAMIGLQEEYPYYRKVPLENTYGMHLYSKLEMTSEVHYFVADDLPSIEAKVTSREGYRFTLFCVHPPPPSPTEEVNSKERDGELLSVAKRIREGTGTTLVVGDFNNVAWSRSSVLFRKTSETIDPRIGRGLSSTFHAKYWFLQFPIDQIFHTADVFTQELKTTPYFGSDHLALFCRFYINRRDKAQEEFVENLEPGEMREVNDLIVEGIIEQGDRQEIATE
jgi:endonuclease/exonuclease/phosphatase (EEP) superfamily protein YafD